MPRLHVTNLQCVLAPEFLFQFGNTEADLSAVAYRHRNVGSRVAPQKELRRQGVDQAAPSGGLRKRW